MQKRVQFCRAIRRGPSGPWDNVARFGQAALDTDAPTSAVVWASPEDGESWPLASAIARTAETVAERWAPLPSSEDLVSGEWLEQIPV